MELLRVCNNNYKGVLLRTPVPVLEVRQRIFKDLIRYTAYTTPEMNEQAILEELLAILEASGTAIRHEGLGGSGGGLCTINGRHIFFVDTQAPSAEIAALAAQAASKIADIEKVYIKPQVRRFIEIHCRNEKSTEKTLDSSQS